MKDLRARTTRMTHRGSTVGLRRSRKGSKEKRGGRHRGHSRELSLTKKGHNATPSGRVVFENPLDASMLKYLEEEKAEEAAEAAEQAAENNKNMDDGAKGEMETKKSNTDERTSGRRRRTHHKRKSTQMPAGWARRLTEDGTKYYYQTSNNLDQVSQWTAPEGSYYEVRDENQQVFCYIDQVTGLKFTYNEKSGEAEWLQGVV